MMDHSQQEVQRKEKNFKTYVILFIVFVLINVVLYFVEGNILRGIFTLLGFSIVLYFGLQKKYWAELVIKTIVWVYVVILIMILLFIVMNKTSIK